MLLSLPSLAQPQTPLQRLEKMERGTLVDEFSSDLMFFVMRRPLYRTHMPRDAAGDTIPHKVGDFHPYVGDDVGMLEAPGKNRPR